MKFLLDTDTCIYALKQNPTVLKHLLAQSREDIAVSVIREAELRTGAAKSTSGARTLQLVENFLRPLGITEFTPNDSAFRTGQVSSATVTALCHKLVVAHDGQ